MRKLFYLRVFHCARLVPFECLVYFMAFQIRIRLLMELASMSGRNVLLVGPSGAGKTCLMNDFLDKQGT